MANFNPPYNLDYAFDPEQPMESQTPKEVYTDKDGKVVDRQEIDDYSTWLEANPPVEVVPIVVTPPPPNPDLIAAEKKMISQGFTAPEINALLNAAKG